MPVLVEGISVIVRRDSIDRRYRGGWRGFLSDVPNHTLCMDAQIARVGFMNPIDVGKFLERLSQRGLTVTDPSGIFVDVAVVDQRTGLTALCKLATSVPDATQDRAHWRGTPAWKYRQLARLS